MLFDTDVLIWVLRGNAASARVIDKADIRHLSIVGYMELLQGARDRADLRAIKSLLSDLGFSILPLTENIGHRAAIYVEEYGLLHSLFMADALIAATAIENHLPLTTGNDKHFKPIRELEVERFRP